MDVIVEDHSVSDDKLEHCEWKVPGYKRAAYREKWRYFLHILIIKILNKDEEIIITG